MSDASGGGTAPQVRFPPKQRGELDSTIDTVVTQVEEEELERGSLAERRAAMRARRRARLFVASLFALIGVVAWNVHVWNQPISDEVLDSNDMQLRLQLALVADKVDEFREGEGRLPNSLEELGVEGRMYRYTRVEDEYYLAILGAGGKVEYVSEEDPRALLAEWNGGAGAGGS